ncbi:hypothetical protein [Protofrankia coriariae]|uniref:hypothetical protein n=1 Tax=Protofrankia coriariae TaxID=1562887 RepID=UPI000B08E255|nr:hypothetical protein [Protofrankia coriariae]
MSRTTYYFATNPLIPGKGVISIFRRRNGPLPADEVFSRDGRWHATDYLRLYRLGHDDDDLVEVSEADANALIDTWTRAWGLVDRERT